MGIETHVKGWAKPGPVPPGAGTAIDVPAGETLDAISGHFNRAGCLRASIRKSGGIISRPRPATRHSS